MQAAGRNRAEPKPLIKNHFPRAGSGPASVFRNLQRFRLRILGASYNAQVTKVAATPEMKVLQRQANWKALSGFLVSGFLFALLGAILPSWGYHLRPEF